MFANYLITALRNFKKNKIYSFINVAGLTIGMVCCLLITFWVNDELSYDNFHENGDQIYRILLQREGYEDFMAITPGLLAAAIKEDVPEVKLATRVMQNHRNPYKHEDKAFYEDRSFCVDPDFFEMFSFSIVNGNQSSPFDTPNDIILTEQTAKKYFGDTDPIGKSLNWNNRSNYKVSAVIKDIPTNSHLDIQLFESHALTERFWKGGYNWTNFVHETYVMLEKNSDIDKVSEKIENILNQNNKFANRYYIVNLQPLKEIYLDADITDSTAISGDSKYVTIFSLIGIGILLIACINFINISTANSLTRAKEVGVRKIIGSDRKSLILFFMIEFLILSLISGLLAVFTLDLLLPYFNQFTNKEFELNIQSLLVLGSIMIFSIVFAGFYPAIYLSSFSPAEALKNQLTKRSGKVSLRTTLIGFQFSVSILLIICAFIVNGQLSYMQNKKLGFDKENLLYLPSKGPFAEQHESVKNRLMQNPEIVNVTMQECVPTTTRNGSWVHWQGQTKEDQVTRNTRVTFDYFRTMNMKLNSGRYFSEEISTDKNEAFILNEAAVKYLEFDEPIGKEISTAGRTGNIVGIVKDANIKSLHHPVEPIIYMGLNNYSSINLFGVVLVKFSSGNFPELLDDIKSVWNEYNPNIPFEYHFLDQAIEKQYGFEKRLSNLFVWFSLITILISCLGLFGLATFVAAKRTKEIGIRKVLGSSILQIVLMLTNEFTKLVIIANVIAWPVAYFLTKNWLQDFAFRIDISIWTFILSGCIAFIVTIVTVGIQTIKTASANPVDSLRNE